LEELRIDTFIEGVCMLTKLKKLYVHTSCSEKMLRRLEKLKKINPNITIIFYSKYDELE